jgi:hypothetical protein
MTQPTNAMQAESLTMEAEAGEWGGDFDPFSDQEEKRVLFAALDSFRYDRLPVYFDMMCNWKVESHG